METCLTILYRVLRYLLKSAIIVCLMRHVAVRETASRAVSVLCAMPVSRADAVHTSVPGRIPGEFHEFSM